MIEKLENLEVWKKSKQLTEEIYRITKKFPEDERYILTSQIRRAVVSVSANIAEGFGRYYWKESIHFYRNAKGSLFEVKSHLYLSFDQEYISQKELDNLLEKIEILTKMINGSIKSTGKSNSPY